jgi:hypothetical protein
VSEAVGSVCVCKSPLTRCTEGYCVRLRVRGQAPATPLVWVDCHTFRYIITGKLARR